MTARLLFLVTLALAGCRADGPGDLGAADASSASDASFALDASTVDAASPAFDGAFVPDLAPTCGPEGPLCGVPVPADCSADSGCGSAGFCLDGHCACADGWRPCQAGCCSLFPTNTTTLANVAGDSVTLRYGTDGTAYILVGYAYSDGTQLLDLYTRAPGGAPIVKSNLHITYAYGGDRFDYAVRSDGTLMIAVLDQGGEAGTVKLYRWKLGDAAPTSAVLGDGFGYQIGIGVAIDAVDTTWVTWSESRDGGMIAYSLTANGTEAATVITTGLVEESDVAVNPATGSAYSFWGDRYTGALVCGVQALNGGTIPDNPKADDAAFDSKGNLWTTYDDYPSNDTVFYGKSSYASPKATGAEIPPQSLPSPTIFIDGEDTAFVLGYDTDSAHVHWFASTDGKTWTHGSLAPFSINPLQGSTSGARAPDGHPTIAVLPATTTGGPLTLYDLP